MSLASIGSEFSGFTQVFGRARSVNALVGSTIAGAVIGGTTAGLIAHFSQPEHDRDPMKTIAIAAGGALAGGILGFGLLTLAGSGPKIGDSIGKNSYQFNTGRVELNTHWHTQTWTDHHGHVQTHTVPYQSWDPVYETRWREAIGDMKLNKQIGNKSGYESVQAAAQDLDPVRLRNKGKELSVLKLGDRYAGYTVKDGGLEWVNNHRATDRAVAAFTNFDGVLHPNR